MPKTLHHPIVPANRPDEDEQLERNRVAKWVPLAVPMLALLMVLLLAFVIGGSR